jgi:hypothetical protein
MDALIFAAGILVGLFLYDLRRYVGELRRRRRYRRILRRYL